MSLAEAYRRAGYVDDRRHASRLATNGGIQERVAWLKEQAAGAAVLTLIERREILAEIARDRTARPADRIAAVKVDTDLAGDSERGMAPDSLAELMAAITT